MKKTNPKPELTEAKLVKALRGTTSLRDFADYLNKDIPADAPGKRTSSSVWQWENEIYSIDQAALWAWQRYYPSDDPRHKLAVDILEIRRKDVPEMSDADKKKVIQAVISRTKANKQKEKAIAS